jgi:hypothetical protein
MARQIKLQEENFVPDLSGYTQPAPVIDRQQVVNTVATAAPAQVMKTVSKTPQDVRNIVNSIPGKDTAVQNAVTRIIIDNPEEAARRAEKAQENEAVGKPNGAVDEFLSALTYFLPTALAGALGTAIGGSEAGVYAIDATGKLQKGYLDNQMAQEELKLKKEKLAIESGKAQQADVDLTPGFIDVRTGQSISTRKTASGFQYIDAENRIVPAQFAKDKAIQIAEMNNQSREASQSRIDQRQYLNLAEQRDRRLDAEVKNFKDPQVNKLSQSYASMQEFENMLNSELPLTSDFVASFVAKGFQGEVGALAEGDVKRSKAPLPVHQRLISNVKSGLLGNMSDAERKLLAKYMGEARKNKAATLKQLAKNRATKEKASRLNVDQEQLEKEYLSTLPDLSADRQKSTAELIREKLRNK